MSVDSVPDDAVKLGRFVGSWRVEGVMVSDAGRQIISGLWRFDRAAEAWGVTASLTTTIEGVGSLEEHELIGVDADSGLIHMFSMNRMVARHHIGGWEEEALVTRYTSDDGVTVEEIRISFPTRDRMEASISEFVDGDLSITTALSLDRRDNGPS